MTVTVSSVDEWDCDCACRGLESVTRQHNRLAWPTWIKIGFMFLRIQKSRKSLHKRACHGQQARKQAQVQQESKEMGGARA